MAIDEDRNAFRPGIVDATADERRHGHGEYLWVTAREACPRQVRSSWSAFIPCGDRSCWISPRHEGKLLSVAAPAALWNRGIRVTTSNLAPGRLAHPLRLALLDDDDL